MLAYVFWHQPQPGVDRDGYEEAQRAFHARLEQRSACFRIALLPFGKGGEAYEDWYLVEDWQGLGELNLAAVDAARRPHHDHAAGMAGSGWGGVYALLRGPQEPPEEVAWTAKPRGQPTGDFLASLDAPAVWRRELVLGPAPEFCASRPGSARTRIWPQT